MKKWFIGLVVLCMFILAAIYIFIPGNITVSHSVKIKSNFSAVNRCLHDNNKWSQWWPKNSTTVNPANKAFSFNGTIYTLVKTTYSSFYIDLKNGNDRYTSKMTIFPMLGDSVTAEWQTTLAASMNPWKRVLQFNQAEKIKNDMGLLLEKLSSFLRNKENIYGLNIQRETITKDTLLVSTNSAFDNYPSTDNVYNLIRKLRDYLPKQGAKETGYPMLNITQTEDSNYTAQVAIPIDKPVKTTRGIDLKRMLPNGYILTGTVTGGHNAIVQGMAGIENYMADYQKSIIAIPFESLITDRSKETDTSKWVTKIYYPVTR